ncbi:MAG: PadR family transcriptional regulator [Candidatus ainarchaeum sp.]|nr:PadR family transcriptional regulator [Candidatus ainarchaeum sp.]
MAVKAGGLAVMRRQMTGMMSAFLLWLIEKKPTHGYEIIRLLRREHDTLKIGPAHIYPVLAALSRRNLIKVERVASGKRIKKLYSVTPLGRKALLKMRKAHFRNSLRAQFLREMLA